MSLAESLPSFSLSFDFSSGKALRQEGKEKEDEEKMLHVKPCDEEKQRMSHEDFSEGNCRNKRDYPLSMFGDTKKNNKSTQMFYIDYRCQPARAH